MWVSSVPQRVLRGWECPPLPAGCGQVGLVRSRYVYAGRDVLHEGGQFLDVWYDILCVVVVIYDNLFP